MNYIQTVSKVRGRGQLPIPQEVRKALNWPEYEDCKLISDDQKGHGKVKDETVIMLGQYK